MASDLEIVNGALSRLGIAPVSAIGENTEAGLLADQTYNIYRDQLIQSHPWKFALKSKNLTDTHTPAPAPWTTAFKKPVDALRILEVNDIGFGGEWDIESTDQNYDIIVMNYAVLAIDVRYIKKVTDSGRFSAGFVDAFMDKLAERWAEPLTSSNSLSDRMAQRAEATIRQARSYDGQEGTPRVVRHHGWTEVR